MSQLEIVTLTLSFVLGLGITQLLSGVITLVRHRDSYELDWLPLVWALGIFTLSLQFWFAIVTWNADRIEWPLSLYLMVVGQAVALFAAGGLIIPSDLHASDSLEADFERNGRLALGAIVVYLTMGAVNNAAIGVGYLHPGNLFGYGCSASAMLVAFSKQRRLRVLGTGAFSILVILALALVWSRPGNLNLTP